MKRGSSCDIHHCLGKPDTEILDLSTQRIANDGLNLQGIFCDNAIFPHTQLKPTSDLYSTLASYPPPGLPHQSNKIHQEHLMEVQILVKGEPLTEYSNLHSNAEDEA